MAHDGNWVGVVLQLQQGTENMKRSTRLASVAACLCFGVVMPVLAAAPPAMPVAAPATAAGDNRGYQYGERRRHPDHG